MFAGTRRKLLWKRLRPVANLMKQYLAEQSGGVAIIFALSVIPVFLSVGLAIDGARGYSTRMKLGAVLDFAALATAKIMRDQDLSDEEAESVASKYVRAHMDPEIARQITTSQVGIAIDRQANTVKVDLSAYVQNYFGSLVSIPRFEVAQTSTASFSVKEVELGIMLDVSGSMGEFGKIKDLKDAMGALTDVMLPDGGVRFKVRIGLAPFSTSVNVGSYASQVKSGNLGSGCVSERTGSAAFSDDAPDSGNKVGHVPTVCPVNPVLALTNNKFDLSAAVTALNPDGSTAGHLGAAWAWYLISPNWRTIWPPESEPKPYGDNKVIKAVILMTDGMFNQEYELASNGTSAVQASNLCQRMKDKGVLVYTVGFQVPGEVLSILRGCATSQTYSYDARDASALSSAFSKIAAELMELRLTK